MWDAKQILESHNEEWHFFFSAFFSVENTWVAEMKTLGKSSYINLHHYNATGHPTNQENNYKLLAW